MRTITGVLLIGMLLGALHQPAFGQNARGQLEKVLFPAGPERTVHDIGARNLTLNETFWKATGMDFGWSGTGRNLKQTGEYKTPKTRHITYRQEFAGLPVVGRFARISTDANDRVTMVKTGFKPSSVREQAFNASPTVSGAESVQLALGHAASGSGRSAEPVLSVLITDETTLVWDVTIWPREESTELQVIVDAMSGRVLTVDDRTLRHTSASTDGVGLVFDPNPLVTSGASYGPPWTDNNDATNAALNAERRQVVLPELSVNASGLLVLEGPHVRITGETSGGAVNYTPPAVASPGDFQFDRSQIHFEAVNAYYHLDKSQRYVQSLGFTDRQNGPVSAHPRAFTRDDSNYTPSLNRIQFGLGGVDDAEDANVVWHEHAHALLEAVSPGLSVTLEGVAVHEGWSDYWAASYARSLVESGLAVRSDWEKLFAWDSGDGVLWSGRTMDHTGIYPEDTCSDDASPGTCSPHNDGRLWATTLMEAFNTLGRTVTDQLVLYSHAYLTAPLTFSDAAEAVVQADVDHFDGQHASMLVALFDSRGLVDASNYAPVLSHDELADRELGGPPVLVELVATGIGSPVESVTMMASGQQLGEVQLTMTLFSGNTYTAELDLPDAPDTIHYWFDVRDTAGRISVLPQGAPTTRFSFFVGTDTTAPVITHVPLSSGSMATWPEVVSATVTDDFAVLRVQVAYEIERFGSGSGSTLSGLFDLSASDNVYTGTFPVSFSDIGKGDVVRYRILASDTAGEPNRSETAEYSFVIQADGLLRAYRLTNAAVVSTGAWHMIPASSFGGALPAGDEVARWAYEQPGTDVAQRHELTLPSLNLDGIDEAWLTFWYRIDSESSGQIDPLEGGPGRALDGGNVQYRTAASDWTTVTPVGGYPTTISSASGNPMAGEPAFGGESHGWRFAVFSVPTSTGMQPRIVFGTDTGNISSGHSGWSISDIRVVTTLPVDQTPPELLAFAVQDRVAIQGHMITHPMPSVGVFDTGGVTDVFVEVRRTGESIVAQRLDQHEFDLSAYSAVVQSIGTPAPGEVVEFRFRIRDWAGNETTAPDDGSWLRSTYVLTDIRDVLLHATSHTAWTHHDSWEVAPDMVSGGVASLNTIPIMVPLNSDVSTLLMIHDHEFPVGTGGTVEVSTDDGKNWTTLAPEEGYPGPMLLPDAHVLAGREGFRGTELSRRSRFDLAPLAGQRILIRMLFAGQVESGPQGAWEIHVLELTNESVSAAFEEPLVLALDTAYPNPFTNRTTVTFSLDEEADVQVRVYDMLGRQVVVLVDGVLPAGSHRAVVDGSRLASGVYMVQLTTRGRTRSRTVVKN